MCTDEHSTFTWLLDEFPWLIGIRSSPGYRVGTKGGSARKPLFDPNAWEYSSERDADQRQRMVGEHFVKAMHIGDVVGQFAVLVADEGVAWSWDVFRRRTEHLFS